MAEKGSFASDLRVLLESGEGADLTLVVGESMLLAHSLILAARSPVLAAMLHNDMREARSRRIQIRDAGEAALRQMLWFVYTDTVPELESVAAELLALAEKYDLPLLKQRCQRQLERDLSVENAAASAALAVLHRCPGLRSAAVEFIAGHPEVLATAGWVRMMRDSAAAAAEVSSLLAAALRQQAAPPNTATGKPDTRIVSRELKQKMTAMLIQAASNGRAREVWVLLAGGAEEDGRDSSGNTALHVAASKGHTKVVKCLLDWGLDANAVNSSGETPLHKATWAGNTEIMWTLVAASARLDAQDNQGQTPLHVAARRIVSRELKQKMTAMLIQAASNGRAREVWALLAGGADKDGCDSSGNTALHVAASKGHTKVVKCLLEGGLDVNAVNSSGETPLHKASWAGNTEIIWMLVAASARVDVQDNQGQTPLHMAARRLNCYKICGGDVCNAHPKEKEKEPDPVVNVLLLAGASNEIKKSQGQTPENVATLCTRSAFKVYSDLY